MPYPRRALPVSLWSDADRAAWSRACQDGDPWDDPGEAARWRPNTRRTVENRYGLWLAHLQDVGRLDPMTSPSGRVTNDALANYVDSLKERGLSPVTIAGRVRDLREAIRVMEPDADLTLLDGLAQRLDAVAEPTRIKRLKVVSPAILLDAAIKEMKKQQRRLAQKPGRRIAERYRDALIIAFLATRPLRLNNLTAIELGRHIEKRDDRYWVRFTGPEMKDEGLPIDFPMPQLLTPWLDLYLEKHRPLLLKGKTSNRLWISIRATPMVDNSIYCRVTEVTHRLIGKTINPHLFRDCVATFIAEEASADVGIIARILGHSTPAAAEDYYNQAGSITAQDRYLSILERLRSEQITEAEPVEEAGQAFWP